MKRKANARKPPVRRAKANPKVGAIPPVVPTHPVRTETELPLLPVAAAPKDAAGHPIVPTCWVRAEVTSPAFPGLVSCFTGEVLRVVKVEHGRDHGATLVYVRTYVGDRWGRCAPLHQVRVRRKPAGVKAREADER